MLSQSFLLCASAPLREIYLNRTLRVPRGIAAVALRIEHRFANTTTVPFHVNWPSTFVAPLRLSVSLQALLTHAGARRRRVLIPLLGTSNAHHPKVCVPAASCRTRIQSDHSRLWTAQCQTAAFPP